MIGVLDSKGDGTTVSVLSLLLFNLLTANVEEEVEESIKEY